MGSKSGFLSTGTLLFTLRCLDYLADLRPLAEDAEIHMDRMNATNLPVTLLVVEAFSRVAAAS